MLGFGVNVTGFEFVNYFARNLDNILIGRYSGPVPSAYYAKAYSLFMLPIGQTRGPVSQAAMPILSALKHEPDRYAKYYNRITDILATLVAPLTAFIFVEADFLVDALLGPQWQGVVPLFRILAVVGLVQGVTTTRGLALLSLGLSSRFLRFGTARAIVVCASFVAGLWHGASGVAAAYAIVEWLILVPSLFYCFRGISLSVRAFLTSLVLPLVLSAIAGGMAFLARHLLGYDRLVGNIWAMVVFLVVYLGASSFRPLVRDTLKRIVAALPFARHTQVKPRQGTE